MLRFLLLTSALSSAVAMAQVLAPETPSELGARFVKLIIAKKSDEAVRLFSQEVQEQLPRTMIDKAWAHHTGGLGAFQKSVEMMRRPMGEKEVIVHRVEFERGAVTTYVTVNKRTLQIEGFQLKPVPKDFVSADYVKAGAFHAEEIAFGFKDFALPATLLIPEGEGKFPAGVLVHGSGPNDRDESIGANKPFRDLAEGLASRGVLVLRYDKRTFTHGSKMANPTIDTEVIDDAVAAVQLLRNRPDVDPKRLVVVGHSLGALLAPQIAKVSGASGAVMLAPPARTPWAILPQQYRFLKVPEEEVAVIEKKLFAVRDGKSQEAVLGAPAEYWRDWASRNGIAVAKALNIPMLVMRGDRDYQVIAEDFAAWKKGLAGMKKVKLVEVPGANHLFIVGTGKPSPAEYEIPGHVAAGVVTAIADFVTASP